MAETLLQKLEEKMLLLLAEVEESRKEMHRLRHENALLRSDKENHSKKIHDLISLLDSVNTMDSTMSNLTTMKPILVQELGT